MSSPEDEESGDSVAWLEEGDLPEGLPPREQTVIAVPEKKASRRLTLRLLFEEPGLPPCLNE